MEHLIKKDGVFRGYIRITIEGSDVIVNWGTVHPNDVFNPSMAATNTIKVTRTPCKVTLTEKAKRVIAARVIVNAHKNGFIGGTFSKIILDECRRILKPKRLNDRERERAIRKHEHIIREHLNAIKALR